MSGKNEKYFDLISSPLEGTNLIEASAGTGKTYTIAGLFVRMILEKKFLAEEILTVTFTEAAAEELRGRIRGRLREVYAALSGSDGAADDFTAEMCSRYRSDALAVQNLRRSLRNFDDAAVYTIHGFCNRMLYDNAFESSVLFDAELVTDESLMISEIIDDFWRHNFYNASCLLTQYCIQKGYNTRYFTSLVKNRSIDPNFKIIPDADRPDITAVEKSLQSSYDSLTKNWYSSRKGVEKIFISDDSLNRTKYRIDSISWLIHEMDDYIAGGNPFSISDNFKKYTAGYISEAVKKSCDPPVHSFFNECEEFLSAYNQAAAVFENYMLSIKKEVFSYVDVGLASVKEEKNVRSFDDLLGDIHKALMGESSPAAKIREKFKAALIDEFQDTDPVQYDIFFSIFGKDRILYLIGDPKQAIYGFRGADIFAYIRAASAAEFRYTLGSNWRSDPDLIKAVNTVFTKNPNPFIFSEIGFPRVGPAVKERKSLLVNGKKEAPLQIWFISNSKKENGVLTKSEALPLISRAAAYEILHLISAEKDKVVIGDRPVNPGDIAVLVRTHFQAGFVLKELQKINIPAVVYGEGSIFKSNEAEEIERIMRAIADPADESNVRAALAADIFGFSGNSLYDLMMDEKKWEQKSGMFYVYRDSWLKHGFMSMFLSLLEQENVRSRILSLYDGERRMTNILHCAEVIHREETGNSHGIEGILKWFSLKRSNDDSEENIRLETDENAVRIITMHRSKGLEFPVVFCPFAWDFKKIKKGDVFKFHDDEKDNNLTLDIGSGNEENILKADIEELAENVRLLYVALTRAMYRCYFAWGCINETDISAPAYLLHSPQSIEYRSLVNSLKAEMGKKDHNILFNEIKELEVSSHGAINVTSLTGHYDAEKYSLTAAETEGSACREFTGKIRRDWMISSFSSLISNRRSDAEIPDHDRTVYDNFKAAHDEYSIFNFHKGSSAGTCIHEIFENLDFTITDESVYKNIINEKLSKYGFEDIWADAVFNMCSSVIDKPLEENGPVLRDIGKDLRLNELEFYFPVERITSAGLSEIFKKYGGNHVYGFADPVKDLGFTAVRGFARGFIDLVFMHGDKYYLIDWKSNHLGSRYSDYSQEALKKEMYKHYYILQYHLYTVALHRYLTSRLPGYEYEKDFGGVYYVFVRGVSKECHEYGIYRDVPSADLVNALNSYFS